MESVTRKVFLTVIFGAVFLDSYSLALKCVLCDSQKDPSCVANTNSSKTVDCKTACFSFINNAGETVRGCAINDDICQNNELCSTCKTDLCNQEVFPESRLQCVQCENCFNSTTLPQMSYCDIYNPEDECYTYFDPKTLLTIRGCTSSSMPPMCGNCNLEKCQTDGCNNKQPEISNFFCYECWGSDQDCVSGKNLEAVRCAHGDRCITQYDNSTGNLWRSCVASKTEECSKEDEANGFCEICTKDKCNDQLMPSDRLYCLQCEGQNATNCYNGTVGSTPCLRAQKFDRCYSYIDHKDVMHRGCESDGFCDGSDQCVYCGKDGCNNVDGNGNPDLPNVGTFSCFTCNGNDVACLLGSVPSNPCEHGNKCLMKVNADKSIERRCVSGIFENCGDNKSCEICNGNMCNGGVFPKDGAELFYMIKIKV